MWKRFLKFINRFNLSHNAVLRNMLNLVKQHCRLVIGRNLRKIQLMLNQNVFDANPHLPPLYSTIPVKEKCRIALVREIMDVKSGIREVANFTIEEVDIYN